MCCVRNAGRRKTRYNETEPVDNEEFEVSDMKSIPREYVDTAVFEGISRRDAEAMLGCLKAYTRSYRAGEFILLDQDRVQHLGVVISGLVHMIKEDPAGRKILLNYLEPGDIFGESFAIRLEARSYVSFYAAANTQVLFLSLEHLVRPCQNNCPFHRQLAENVLRLVGEEYHRLIEKVEICSQSSLREKILCYMTLLSQRQGQKYITVPLSRTEMAAFLQSNRSAMTRELAAMRDEGLIDFDGSTFMLGKMENAP